MIKYFSEVMNDAEVTIKFLPRIKIEPDPRYKKKLKDAIEYLGDKYVLAKPMKKVQS